VTPEPTVALSVDWDRLTPTGADAPDGLCDHVATARGSVGALGPHMEQPSRIDGFALCASPFAAPAVLALFGLVFDSGSSNSGGIFSVLLWQAVLAFEYLPFYLGVSLPTAWLLWRLCPSFCSKQNSTTLPLLVAGTVFAFSANARALGCRAVGPLEPEAFSFIVGAVFNAIAFVSLSHRAPIIVRRRMMGIKASTTVSVRILGLIALLKGVTTCISTLSMFSRSEAFSKITGVGWWLVMRSTVVTSLVPIIVAIICLAYSKPLVELLTKGIDENS